MDCYARLMDVRPLLLELQLCATLIVSWEGGAGGRRLLPMDLVFIEFLILWLLVRLADHLR